MSSLLTLLQISDSAFPTGGYSHSSGLETSLKHSLIKNKAQLQKFFLCTLENNGSFTLPFVLEAHEKCWATEELVNLDKKFQSYLSNHVARRASERQGKSMLESCSKAFRVEQILLLTRSLPHSHQPIVFGSVCGIMGIDLNSTLEAFMFSSLRTVVASAVRLDKIGPLEAQVIQTDLQRQIPEMINRNKDRRVPEAAIVCPVIDILQNSHDTMFSKLFYS